MPIDHPSDLPDDAGRADEWRAVEDSQAPGGRRPNPAEQAAEQPQPRADERPGDRLQPSSAAPAANAERPDAGKQQADDERRAPDTQPVGEARPDAGPATAEAPDPPEAATAEPRTRQEHADTDHPEGSPNPAARSDEPYSKHPQSPDATGGQQQFDDEQSTSNADYPRETEDADHESLVAGQDSDEPKDQFIESTIETDPDKGIGPDSEAEPPVDKASNQAPPNPRDEVHNLPAAYQAKDSTSPDRQASSGNDTLPDNPVHPLTDAEWAEHVTEAIDDLDKARVAGLTAKRLYTINGAGEVWTEERDSLHESLINDLYSSAASVPCEKKAIIAGGLGGAGKTTVLTGHAGIDLSQYLMINPDNIKEEMAKRGMIPAVGAISPMEASDLVHEESSYLAKRLARRAEADGKNVIWDITMSSEDSTKERITNLRSVGYERIEGVFVDIPVETSISRTDSRHREGHERYRLGEGLGGRYVPEKVIKDQIDSEWGSKNRRIYETMKPRFDHWSVYDNSVDGRDPILVDEHDEANQHRRP